MPDPHSPSPEAIATAFELLQRHGYCNEFTSNLGASIHDCKGEIEKQIRAMGYRGRELETGGDFYPDYGSLDWLYDPDRLTHEQARSISDQYVLEQGGQLPRSRRK